MSNRYNSTVSTMVTGLAQFQDSLKPAFTMLRGLQKVVRPFSVIQGSIPKTAITMIGQFARHAHNSESLEKAGWLPHQSTPYARIGECQGDSKELDRLLALYYKEQWAQVRRDIESRLNRYHVDDEFKATFREALVAHENELYRCVCCVLMPAIERVARIECHDDDTKKVTTSQHWLREQAMNVRLSSLDVRGFYAGTLFRRFSKHLYDNAREGERQRFERDPVPNRHAALHGIVAYSSMKNSLNAIFITEFLLQVICAVKKSSAEDAVEE